MRGPQPAYGAPMSRPASTLMTALGFPRSVDRLYHRVLAQSGREVVSVATSLLMTPEELEAQLAPLLEHDIARIE